MKTKTSTIDPEEVEKFSRIADEWWDKKGKFKALHDINPLRTSWILDELTAGDAPKKAGDKLLSGLSLLDIGCGGGLMSESFARLGAQVTAIDASEKNIAVAKIHAEKSGLDIDYRCMPAEDLAESDEQFDVVIALEIIEHVVHIPTFMQASCQLIKPGGSIFYSTINRTMKSYALAIIGAEYILQMVPRGTHDWGKFVKPSELCRQMQKHDVQIDGMTGMVMNPLKWQWELNQKDVDVNYLLKGKKAKA